MEICIVNCHGGLNLLNMSSGSINPLYITVFSEKVSYVASCDFALHYCLPMYLSQKVFALLTSLLIS